MTTKQVTAAVFFSLCMAVSIMIGTQCGGSPPIVQVQPLDGSNDQQDMTQSGPPPKIVYISGQSVSVCPSGYDVISGGCTCQTGALVATFPVGVPANGWQCVCTTGTASSVVVCQLR